MAVHGVSLQHHIIQETALVAVAPVTASTAVPLESCVLKPNKEYVDISDLVRTRAATGWIQGKISGEFQLSAQLRLGASVTALPIHNVLMRAIWGTAPIVGGASVTWNHNTFAQPVLPFTIVQQGGAVTATSRNEYFLHQAKGCVVKKATFTVEGGKPTMLEVEGEFADYDYMFGAPAVGATVSAGGSSVTLQANNSRLIKDNGNGAGFYVQLGSNDNSGAGYRVTHSASGNTLTISGGLTGADINDGDAIIPFFPASVAYAGAHLDGIANNMNINDGVAPAADLGFTKAVLSCETGHFLMNKQATSETAHRIGTTMRKWSGEVTFYLENEMAFIQAESFVGTEYALEMRLGGTAAGSRYRMSFPAARFDTINEIPFEQEDEGTEVTATFHARRTSGENDCTLVQD